MSAEFLSTCAPDEAPLSHPSSSRASIPKEVKLAVREAFLLTSEEHYSLEPLALKLKHLQEPLIPALNAFQNNLGALSAVAGLPRTLALGIAVDTHFQNLLVGQRIRRIHVDRMARDESGELTKEDEEEAAKAARGNLDKDLATDEGQVQILQRTLQFLFSALQSGDVASGARELLRQSAVLCWGALEVLAREVFVVYVNTNPSAARALAEHPSTRGRFDLKAISVEVLEMHGFDVSGRMGDVLLQHQDLAELGAIKDVYQVLFPSARALHSALAERDLWVLNQRRHLIVHKRGIIDARYLERTGEKAELGSVLHISPAELERYITLVRDAGVELLGATNPLDKSSIPESDNDGHP